jgi:micrococcal nuclease
MLLTDKLYGYLATVNRVVDGDTCVLDVQLGFHLQIQLTVRLYGLNAPEASTPEGKQAKAWLDKMLPAGQQVWVQTLRDKTEKYGRMLGNLHRVVSLGQADDQSVNAQMVAAKSDSCKLKQV